FAEATTQGRLASSEYGPARGTSRWRELLLAGRRDLHRRDAAWVSRFARGLKESRLRGGRRLRPTRAYPPPCSRAPRAGAGTRGRPVSKRSERRTRFPRSNGGLRTFAPCFRREQTS